MNAREVLLKAAELIEPEGCWTRGVNARDALGVMVDPRHVQAVCWCTYGAIWRAGGPDGARTAVPILRQHLTTFHISKWNDAPSRTQAEVVSALRAAAELAK